MASNRAEFFTQLSAVGLTKELGYATVKKLEELSGTVSKVLNTPVPPSDPATEFRSVLGHKDKEEAHRFLTDCAKQITDIMKKIEPQDRPTSTTPK